MAPIDGLLARLLSPSLSRHLLRVLRRPAGAVVHPTLVAAIAFADDEHGHADATAHALRPPPSPLPSSALSPPPPLAKASLATWRVGVPGAPSAAADQLVLQTCRAASHYVVTSAENLRREPGLRFAPFGPHAPELAAWRRAWCRAKGVHPTASPRPVILTRGGGGPAAAELLAAHALFAPAPAPAAAVNGEAGGEAGCEAGSWGGSKEGGATGAEALALPPLIYTSEAAVAGMEAAVLSAACTGVASAATVVGLPDAHLHLSGVINHLRATGIGVAERRGYGEDGKGGEDGGDSEVDDGSEEASDVREAGGEGGGEMGGGVSICIEVGPSTSSGLYDGLYEAAQTNTARETDAAGVGTAGTTDAAKTAMAKNRGGIDSQNPSHDGPDAVILTMFEPQCTGVRGESPSSSSVASSEHASNDAHDESSTLFCPTLLSGPALAALYDEVATAVHHQSMPGDMPGETHIDEEGEDGTTTTSYDSSPGTWTYTVLCSKGSTAR